MNFNSFGDTKENFKALQDVDAQELDPEHMKASRFFTKQNLLQTSGVELFKLTQSSDVSTAAQRFSDETETRGTHRGKP